MDALVSRILPLLSRTPPHGCELARFRRSGPEVCLSESREGVLMDVGRADSVTVQFRKADPAQLFTLLKRGVKASPRGCLEKKKRRAPKTRLSPEGALLEFRWSYIVKADVSPVTRINGCDTDRYQNRRGGYRKSVSPTRTTTHFVSKCSSFNIIYIMRTFGVIPK